MSSNASVNVIQGDSMQSERREKVAIIGSGNWGSAIASVAAKNALARPQQFQPEIVMWVFEEDYQGKPLSQVINETHMNPKYLPDIPLGENVIAEPDLAKVLDGATALVIVFPHQFFHDILKQMAGKVEKGAKAVSLIKVSFSSPWASADVTYSNHRGCGCTRANDSNICNDHSRRVRDLLLFA
ncbi:glycerol-3-phosphate dehydrogenase [Serendipita sp. 397]|nr:glycerol-3-phosphate dehydrogenase [Serendipita sp. 397]